MQEHGDRHAGRDETPVERLLRKDRDEAGVGKPLSRRAMQTQRTLENYLKAGNRPRWMERLVDIERGTAHERRRLEAAYRTARDAHRGDPQGFADRWRETVAGWRLDDSDLNDLIEQHN